MKLPLYVRIECIRREEDAFFYGFICSVPPHFGGRIVAEVVKDGDDPFRAVVLHQNGLTSLSDELAEEFVCLVARLARSEMVKGDGFEIEMMVSDISPFLPLAFGAADKASIQFALGHFVDPSVAIADATIVRVD